VFITAAGGALGAVVKATGAAGIMANGIVAAGGYADQDTAAELSSQGVDIYQTLKDNDAYHALKRVGGLIMTGSTGTNVNDAALALLKR